MKTAVTALAALVLVGLSGWLGAAPAPIAPLAESFPNGAWAYGEANGLAPHIKSLASSELVASIKASPEYTAYQATEDYANAQKGLNAVELVLGMDLWKAAERLLGGQVGAALYPKADSEKPDALLIVRPASQFAYFRQKLWLGPVLAVGGQRIEEGILFETEGIKAWQTKGDGGDPAYLMLGRKWFAVSTQRALLEKAVRLEEDGKGKPLTTNKNFQQFTKQFDQERLGRLFLDAKKLHAVAPRLNIPEKAESGMASLLFGGLMELAAESPQLGVSLDIEENQYSIELAGSGDPADLPEHFAVFFTDPPKTGSRVMPEIDGFLAGTTLYRDLGSWYRDREKFLQPQALPGFDQFETGIGNLLPGHDIGEDVLPLFGSNFTILSARQSYDHLEGRPGVELPGFAILASLEEPEKATDVLQLLFQTFLSVLNLQAAEQKRQPWLIETVLHDETKITFARYLDQPEGDDLPPIFNFQPAAARVGDEYIMSSSVELCRQLIDALKSGDRKTVATEDIKLTVSGEILRKMLEDNREHLEVAQVTKGRDAEEAQRDVNTLLRLMERMQGLQLATRTTEDGFSIRADIETVPPPPEPEPVTEELPEAEPATPADAK